jgi:hypothetical protein
MLKFGMVPFKLLPAKFLHRVSTTRTRRAKLQVNEVRHVEIGNRSNELIRIEVPSISVVRSKSLASLYKVARLDMLKFGTVPLS